MKPSTKTTTTTTVVSAAAATKSKHLTMESLALPQDLYWDGKMEPISPPCSELFSIAEPIDNHWPYDDNFANEITLITEGGLELKPGFLEFSQELLDCEDLVVELYDLKEEQWINSKLPSPPHLLDYPSIGTIVAHPNPITKVLQQSPLDGGAGFFGLASASATVTLTELTPPHSPTQHHCSGNSNNNAFQTQIQIEGAANLNDLILHNASHQTQPAAVSSNVHQTLPSYLDYATQNSVVLPTSFAGGDFPDDIAAKTQLVDEIVQHAAKALPDWYVDNNNESQFSYSAPPSHSDTFDDDDNNNNNGDEDEWMPSEEGSSSCNYDADAASASSFSASAGSSPVCSSGEEFAAAPSSSEAPSTKKRTRPYGRGVEDRKIRKKEQNKNAATRYRQKKKQEMEVVLGEEHVLAQRNAELKRTFAEKQREAKYLKTLIREFYQDKKKRK